MGEKHIANSRYEYVSEKGSCPAGVIDIHYVRVLRTGGPLRILFLCFGFAVLFFLLRDDLDIFTLCYTVAGLLFLRLIIHKQVVKESVVILPGFGVQLESHYRSGRVIRRFVPVNKILKPLLNQCVTPVTCYWSLALLLREENELMLVFKELHPTLEMLTPIWKSLCAGIDPNCFWVVARLLSTINCINHSS